MRLLEYRGPLVAGLGVALVLLYTSFVTTRTYYNPFATALIFILEAFIVAGGLLSHFNHWKIGATLQVNPFIARVTSAFSALFLLTITVLFADVVLTLYAVSVFGTQVEANRVVASLIRNGQVLTWLGEQFTPGLIAGFLFWLSRNAYVQTISTFFVLGTLGYAVATVLNDVLVVYNLSVIRA